jgi:signal transduction histidine kinase
VLRAVVRTDRLAQLMLAAYLGVVLYYVAKLLGPLRFSGLTKSRFAELVLFSVLVVALLQGLRRVASRDERRFWRELAIAFGCWLAVIVLRLLPVELAAFTQQFVIEVLYAVYYVAFVLALERRPHLPPSQRTHRLLASLPTVTLFVLGLFIYFVLVPMATNRELFESLLPSSYLYVILDCYLAVRIFHLARVAREDYWRRCYSLIAIAAALIVVVDVTDSYYYFRGVPRVFWVVEVLTWHLGVVVLALAARLRTLPDLSREVETAAQLPAAAPPTPYGHTLLFALAFPSLHYLVNATAFLDDASRPARELLVIVWLLLIGTVALVQTRLLSKSHRQLEEETIALNAEILWRQRVEEERRHFIAELEAKNAEVEARNAEMERYTYVVSHDLKTPLVTIRGFLGLLRRDLDSGNEEKVKHDLERIAKAVGTMGELLDQLLEISRISRVVDAAEEVAMSELAREATERVARRGAEIQVDPGLPVVFGDRRRLLEVLENLLENAVKFSADEPEPRIEVGFRPGESPTVFYVSDNGIGIDPRYHQKIFGLFDRLNQDLDGTGVGLALVKRIVEGHGGRIWVESEGVGRGATFCFTLPGHGFSISGAGSPPPRTTASR